MTNKTKFMNKIAFVLKRNEGKVLEAPCTSKDDYRYLGSFDFKQSDIGKKIPKVGSKVSGTFTGTITSANQYEGEETRYNVKFDSIEVK